jgi:hypothetical protein
MMNGLEAHFGVSKIYLGFFCHYMFKLASIHNNKEIKLYLGNL